MQIENTNFILFNIFESLFKYIIFIIITGFPVILPQETNPLQNQKQLTVLSINECLNIALENNHKLKAQKQGIQLSQTKKKQAESGYWPQINARASYSYFDQDLIFSIPEFQINLPQIAIQGLTISLPPFNVPRQNIKLMDQQNIQGFLEMSFPLYTGGKLNALNEQAEIGIEISKQEFRKSNLEIQYDVTRYYYGALLAKKIHNIGTDALERLEITLKLTQNLYENGSGKVTKLDYLKNKVTVDQVRIFVTEMKKNVLLSKNVLAFTMGTDIEFDISDEDLPFIKKDSIQADNSEIIDFSDNPDWEKTNAAILFFKAKIDEAYSGYLPKVGIIGNFAQNINAYKNGITNKYNNQIWMVGIGTEIPLFNGFRTSNEVTEAKVLLNKTEEERLFLQDALSLQIKEALQKVESSEENVNNLLQAIASASENRSLSERAFEQDMVETKDLIQAQLMESIIEAQYQKAIYDHIEAKAYLKFITGKTF